MIIYYEEMREKYFKDFLYSVDKKKMMCEFFPTHL